MQNLPQDAASARTATHRIPRGLMLLSVLPSLFLVAPLAALVYSSFSPSQWTEALRGAVLPKALGLSLATTALSLLLILLFGTPFAYLLARHRFPGKRLLDTVIDLPTVLPPAVAGLGLLMTFGRKGVLGPLIGVVGSDIAFTTAAVVIAQCFVAAPFYIRAARAGFESVDPDMEDVAATLGVPDAAIFWRVTVPMALPSLLGGAVMAWARALGEFGATIMFAGNFPGRTQTMPLAVYTELENDLGGALTLALILLLVSCAVLVLPKLALERRSREARA